MSTKGHSPTDVRDAPWEGLEPLLPKSKGRPGGPGRKPLARRRVMNGIVYVNKTGGPWRMMPPTWARGTPSLAIAGAGGVRGAGRR
jgi:transposase